MGAKLAISPERPNVAQQNAKAMIQKVRDRTASRNPELLLGRPASAGAPFSLDARSGGLRGAPFKPRIRTGTPTRRMSAETPKNPARQSKFSMSVATKGGMNRAASPLPESNMPKAMPLLRSNHPATNRVSAIEEAPMPRTVASDQEA